MKTRAKQVRIFIAVFVTLLVISIIIAPLRGPFIKIGMFEGIKLSSFVGFLLNGGVAFYFMKKYSGALCAGNIFFATLLGACIVDILAHLLLDTGLSIVPEQFTRSLGVIFAYAIYKGNRMVRLLLPVAGLLLCLWMSLVGYDLWLHKLNFGAFTGRIESTATPDFQLLLADNYRELHGYDEAERHLQTAAAMCPVRFMPLYELAKLHDATGRREEALTMAKQINN
jgi:hypothetical protein